MPGGNTAPPAAAPAVPAAPPPATRGTPGNPNTQRPRAMTLAGSAATLAVTHAAMPVVTLNAASNPG
ncbi:MAG TPA: hypothetical protein VNK05_06590 [Chloroflexota bacterium]|nr:hypothetical protein [Chloroflexota bacterium]